MTQLVRDPKDWRDVAGEIPDGPLILHQVGPELDADRPGWVTVTGWRDQAGNPWPVWATVQVRADVPDRRPRPHRLSVRTIVAAVVSGVLFAGLSLSTVSWIVYATVGLDGLDSVGLPLMLVAYGTLAGSVAGWYAQPAVSMLVAAVGRGLRARRKRR